MRTPKNCGQSLYLQMETTPSKFEAAHEWPAWKNSFRATLMCLSEVCRIIQANTDQVLQPSLCYLSSKIRIFFSKSKTLWVEMKLKVWFLRCSWPMINGMYIWHIDIFYTWTIWVIWNIFKDPSREEKTEAIRQFRLPLYKQHECCTTPFFVLASL